MVCFNRLIQIYSAKAVVIVRQLQLRIGNFCRNQWETPYDSCLQVSYLENGVKSSGIKGRNELLFKLKKMKNAMRKQETDLEQKIALKKIVFQRRSESRRMQIEKQPIIPK